MRWQHNDSQQLWELVDGTRVLGAIADEYLASIPADDWEDRNVLETVFPWFDAPAEPVMVMRFVPGLQSKIKQKFGMRLPDEAKDLATR